MSGPFERLPTQAAEGIPWPAAAQHSNSLLATGTAPATNAVPYVPPYPSTMRLLPGEAPAPARSWTQAPAAPVWRTLPGEEAPVTRAPLQVRPGMETRQMRYLPGEVMPAQASEVPGLWSGSGALAPDALQQPAFGPPATNPYSTALIKDLPFVVESLKVSVDVRDFGALGKPVTGAGEIRGGDLSRVFLTRGNVLDWLPAGKRRIGGTCRPGIGILGADSVKFNGKDFDIPWLGRVTAVDLGTNSLLLDRPAPRPVAGKTVVSDDAPPIQDALNFPILRVRSRRVVIVPPGEYRLGVPGAFKDDKRPGNQPLFIQEQTLLSGVVDDPNPENWPNLKARWPLLKLADEVCQVRPGESFGSPLDRCLNKQATILMNQHNGFWSGQTVLPDLASSDLEIAFLRLHGNREGQSFSSIPANIGAWAGGSQRLVGIAGDVRDPQKPQTKQTLKEGFRYYAMVSYTNGVSETSGSVAQVLVTEPGRSIVKVEINPSGAPKGFPTPRLYFRRGPLDPMADLECPPLFFRIALDPKAVLQFIGEEHFAGQPTFRAPGFLPPTSNSKAGCALHIDNVVDVYVHDLSVENAAVDGILIAGGADRAKNPKNEAAQRLSTNLWPTADEAPVNVADCRLERVEVRYSARQGLGIGGRVDRVEFVDVLLEENNSGGCDIEPLTGVTLQRWGSIRFVRCVMVGHHNVTTAGLRVGLGWVIEFDSVDLEDCIWMDNDIHLVTGPQLADAGVINHPPRGTVNVKGGLLTRSTDTACKIFGGTVNFLPSASGKVTFRDNARYSALKWDMAGDIHVEGVVKGDPLAVRMSDCLIKRRADRLVLDSIEKNFDFGAIFLASGVSQFSINGGAFDGGNKARPDLLVRISRAAALGILVFDVGGKAPIDTTADPADRLFYRSTV